MRNLPDAIIYVLHHFELAFSEPVWEWARILLIGAILVPDSCAAVAQLEAISPRHQPRRRAGTSR